MGEVCGLCREGGESGRALGICPLRSGFGLCASRSGVGVGSYGKVPHGGTCGSPDGGLARRGPCGWGNGDMMQQSTPCVSTRKFLVVNSFDRLPSPDVHWHCISSKKNLVWKPIAPRRLDRHCSVTHYGAQAGAYGNRGNTLLPMLLPKSPRYAVRSRPLSLL